MIPKTLEECYIELSLLSGSEAWLKTPEHTATANAHHGVGRDIRNDWGLWKGEGELYEWFKLNGVNHPDDMSHVIITSYYRYMNKKDIKLDEQIDDIIDFFLTEKEKILRRRKKKLDKINNDE